MNETEHQKNYLSKTICFKIKNWVQIIDADESSSNTNNDVLFKVFVPFISCIS